VVFACAQSRACRLGASSRPKENRITTATDGAAEPIESERHVRETVSSFVRMIEELEREDDCGTSRLSTEDRLALANGFRLTAMMAARAAEDMLLSAGRRTRGRAA